MIEIKIQNNRENADHFLSGLTDSIMDETLKSAKEHFESGLKNVNCDIHKSKSIGTITKKTNNDKTQFEYSGFCCDDFKVKVKKEGSP